jgi:hypothetical protein
MHAKSGVTGTVDYRKLAKANTSRLHSHTEIDLGNDPRLYLQRTLRRRSAEARHPRFRRTATKKGSGKNTPETNGQVGAKVVGLQDVVAVLRRRSPPRFLRCSLEHSAF